MILEFEESNYEKLLHDNHHFLSSEITKFLESNQVSERAFREGLSKFIEDHDLGESFHNSLVATWDGKVIMGNETMQTIFYQQKKDYQMIVSFLPNDWVLMTRIPENLLAHYKHRNIWLIILSIMIMIGLTVALHKLVLQILARPIRKLTQVAHSLVQGEKAVEDVEIHANLEIRILANEIFALREKLEIVSTASKQFEDILSVSYLEKMDIEEFTLSIFEALSGFIGSEQLNLYIYDQEELRESYSYPAKQSANFYTGLRTYLVSQIELEEEEIHLSGEEYDLMIYPLRSQSCFLGYLVIEFPCDHQLRPQDREIISFVQTRFVYARINTQYFERLKAEKEKLHIHSSKMELMVILANELREVVDLPRFYQGVCRKICEYFGFNMAFLLRPSLEGSGYRCPGFFQWEAPLGDQSLATALLSSQKLTRILEEIYQTGREMYCQDISVCLGEDWKLVEEFLGVTGYHEVVFLPVFRHRQMEGVLALEVTGIQLDPMMMGLLKIYSQIVGEEIARLDLLQEREQYVEDLEIERKRLKENIGELERTKEALAIERFKRLKDNLITEFSHDMRTPLTVLSGYLDLFRKNAFNPEVTEKIIRTMQEETNYLISMVENLLESAKILSEGKDGEQVTEVGLARWLEHLIKSHSLYRERVSLHTVGDARLQLYTDEGKLNKIITNLIDNACKYSKDQVKIVIKQVHGDVAIIVKDYGIGMKRTELPCIFKKFYRIKNAKTRGMRGSGLGLFVVKEYTEQLGGSVQVYSIPNKGTTFLLCFPDENSSRCNKLERVCNDHVS